MRSPLTASAQAQGAICAHPAPDIASTLHHREETTCVVCFTAVKRRTSQYPVDTGVYAARVRRDCNSVQTAVYLVWLQERVV